MGLAVEGYQPPDTSCSTRPEVAHWLLQPRRPHAMRRGGQKRRGHSRAALQLTRFLLELGAGFSYLGKQYKIEVSGDEFFIDLLFYHVKLHCYVVVELKTVKFKPEFAGQLNFY